MVPITHGFLLVRCLFSCRPWKRISMAGFEVSFPRKRMIWNYKLKNNYSSTSSLRLVTLPVRSLRVQSCPEFIFMGSLSSWEGVWKRRKDEVEAAVLAIWREREKKEQNNKMTSARWKRDGGAAGRGKGIVVPLFKLSKNKILLCFALLFRLAAGQKKKGVDEIKRQTTERPVDRSDRLFILHCAQVPPTTQFYRLPWPAATATATSETALHRTFPFPWCCCRCWCTHGQSTSLHYCPDDGSREQSLSSCDTWNSCCCC